MKSLPCIPARHIVVAVAGLLAAGSLANAQELKTINFMSPNESSCSVFPQFAMQAFGFLEKEGYKINFLSADSNIPPVAFLQNGDADIAMIDAPETLLAVQGGYPIKLIYETHHFSPDGIVVLTDSPVTKLSELKGKKIGLAEQEDDITTTIALNAIGMTIDDVSTFVVGNQGPIMANALRTGAIDAFAGGSTDRAALEAQGITFRNITPDAVSKEPGNALIVWGPSIEEKRPMIQAFARAWAEAQASGLIDPKAVIASCKTFVPEQFENLDLGSKMVEYSIFTTQLRRTVNYGDLQPDVWAGIQSGYIKAGVLAAEIDPKTFLDTSFQTYVRDFTTEDVKAGVKKWKDANPDLVIP